MIITNEISIYTLPYLFATLLRHIRRVWSCHSSYFGETQGPFHSTKCSCFHFPEFLEKGTTSWKVYPNFENFWPEISVPFYFPLGIFGWMVRISETQQFSDFPETFPGNLRTICARFEIFWNFWLNAKRPQSCLNAHDENKRTWNDAEVYQKGTFS